MTASRLRLPDFEMDLGPELEAAMAEHLAEVEAIATGVWPPTFEDTIEALEGAGERLHLAERLLMDAVGSRSTAEIKALEAEMMPRLAAHWDAVVMDARVFERIADLVARRQGLGLDGEQACVLERYHRDLVRAGATLGPAEQAELAEINQRLSALQAQFRANLAAETTALAVRVETDAELDGLPAPMVEAAARAAGDDGGYLLKLQLAANQPALEHLHDRSLRERLWQASVARGRRGGEHDNRATITEIAALRAERAGLLGYRSHAEYMVADQTVGSVEAVIDLLGTVGRAAAAAARAEEERHTAALHADGHAGPLEPWDFPYYAARERQARHAGSSAGLQEYFVLDRVIADGLFAVAGELYGLAFTERDDLPRPGPDIRAFAVSDAGGDRGVLYVDPFASDGKMGGGWMDTYADTAPFIGRLPAVYLALNAERPADGAAALLTSLDVRILFHEFGHVLHVLLSDVAYPRVAGINVAHDVVEFPSKLHESLFVRPDVIVRYARHHATGEPIAQADVEALNALVREGAAYISTQGAAGALLDQAWHGLAPGETVAPEAVDDFEAAVLERHGLDLHAIGGPTERSTFFSHVFAGPYPGTHYSYTWSAVLEAIALQWLDENGGLTLANGRRLRQALLSRGATVDPIGAIEELTGRPMSVQPMLARRGLAMSG